MSTSFSRVFLLWGAGLGAAAQYAKVSVVFDQLPQIYPDAGASLGWAVSLVGLIGIVFGVAAGIVVARIRYRRALISALWLGAGISLLQGFLPPLEWFLALRALEGLSHLAMVVAAPTLIAQISAPHHRGFTLTLWGTFFGVAFALLTWGGLPLVEAYGVGALFWAHSLYMAVFAVILARVLQSLPDTAPTDRFSFVKMLKSHAAIYRSAHIAAPGIGWLFYTFCFVSVLTVMPPYLADDHRALVMGAMPLASIVSSMTLGVVMLRSLTAIQVTISGFASSALAMVWLWASPGDPWACLTLAATLGLVQGASFTAVPQLNETPETQAQANGAMAQMGNLGNTLGTPVMVAGLLAFGYTALPLFVGGALMAGLIVHLVLARLRST
jgi:DHA1 family inner membrane transport protein